jgi:hypothetical protein
LDKYPIDREGKVKNKTSRRAVVKNIRKQLQWIEEAITDGDTDWLERYANQLAGSAYLLIDEDYLERNK